MTRPAGGSSRGSPRYNAPMRRTTWVRAGLLAVGGVLAVAAAAFVAVVPPTEHSLYPKCQLYQTTGLHCMGCGLTRSAHSLLNGQVLQAFAYNIAGPLLVGWAAFEAGRRGWAWLRGRPDPGWWFRVDWTPWVMLVLGVYMVLRNLPWWPFTVMAPHELG